ncbi:GIY-YIG nuclease family protein [Nonlabens sp. Hel1_33_55]|uniref:GIY-YIG nuclease family protein n=1 Tax=Nonlabens sp. Hel1_33_55 TaxID=1336802 RepID=UPI001E54545F|nr:GIY-YIG nuclease family protein [Nonlabens sp. Hel1_33_55]
MFTYIIAHIKNRLLYVGVTNDIKQRAFDHKNATFETHTGHYNIKQLVWYEKHNHPLDAIRREKLIKKWKREYKINLIESINPEWIDLSADWDFTGFVTSKKRFENND